MDFKTISFKESINQVLNVQMTDLMKKRILATLGLEVADCDEEKRAWAQYIYRSQELHLNPYDGVHGGIACTIADSCMGTTICAATQTLPSTTDISASFLSPMPKGEYLVRVEIKKTGKQLASATCEIKSLASGGLCVIATGRFVLVRKDILADDNASELLKEQNK